MASDFENAARQRIRLPGLHQKSQLKPRSFRAKSGSSPRRARRLATRWTSWRCKPARWPSTMVPRLRAQRRGPRRSPNRKTRYPSSPQPSRELLGQLRGPSSRGTPDQLRELSVQPQASDATLLPDQLPRLPDEFRELQGQVRELRASGPRSFPKGQSLASPHPSDYTSEKRSSSEDELRVLQSQLRENQG